MMALITGAAKALRMFLGSRWWVLLALAAAAAWFYVDARRARADRDAWSAWADRVCAFAGAAAMQGKPRGQLCAQAVQDLAHFKAASQAETARLLVEAQRAREEKAAGDRAAAAADAADRRLAGAQMEEADAQVREDDRVDGNWFAALNRLGGLR